MAGATGTVDGLSHWFGETNVVQLLWMAGATGYSGWLVPLDLRHKFCTALVDGWCHCEVQWMAGATRFQKQFLHSSFGWLVPLVQCCKNRKQCVYIKRCTSQLVTVVSPFGLFKNLLRMTAVILLQSAIGYVRSIVPGTLIRKVICLFLSVYFCRLRCPEQCI